MGFLRPLRFLTAVFALCLTMLGAAHGDTSRLSSTAPTAVTREQSAQFVDWFLNSELPRILAEMSFSQKRVSIYSYEPPTPTTPELTDEETPTEYILRHCTTHPLDESKTICITFYIDKATGNVRIKVDNLIPLLPVTYHIRCNPDGTCEIIDDLPGFLKTRFCVVNRDAAGKVTFTCKFKYLIFNVNEIVHMYVENGKLCIKIGDSEPSCKPISDFPPLLLEIWEVVHPQWLPPFPTHLPDDGSGPMGPPAPDQPIAPPSEQKF